MISRWDGRTAVITGGASGIGLAMARSFARRGAKVALLDVEEAALRTAVDQLAGGGSNADVRGYVADVSYREQMEDMAFRVERELGPVHVLCANAGVGGGGGPAHQLQESDWRWTLGVNLMGVVHTVQGFLPRMLAHGEEGHVVHTASMAGMISPPNMSPYNVSKFGVVALAEAMEAELDGTPVGVSVLCPGFVSTRIHESVRNRPDAYGSAPATDGALSAISAQLVTSGIPVEPVAERVVEAVEAGEFYIFTHPAMRAFVEARFNRIRQALDAAEESPALAGLPRDLPAMP